MIENGSAEKREWLLRFHSFLFSFSWFCLVFMLLSFAGGGKALIHASPGADRICYCLPVFSLCRFAFSSNSQRFAAFLRHFVFLLHNPHNHGFSLLYPLTVICPLYLFFLVYFGTLWGSMFSCCCCVGRNLQFSGGGLSKVCVALVYLSFY